MKILDNFDVEWRSIPTHPHVFVALDGRVMVDGVRIYHPSKPSSDVYITTNHLVVGLTTRLNRLIAMSWKELPEDHENLVVNHLDGIIHNNHPDNLEWCTQKRNVEHAFEIGLSKGKEVYALNPDGIIDDYTTIADCARVTGLSRETVSANLKVNTVYHVNGLVLANDRNDLLTYTPSPEVSVMSGKIVLYKDDVEIGMFGSFRKMDESGLAPQARRGMVGLLNKCGSDIGDGWVVKFRLDGKEYSIPPETIREATSNRKPGVIYLHNVVTGETTKFDNKLEAEKTTGCNRKIMLGRINKESLMVVAPGYRVSEDPNEDWGTPLTTMELRMCSKPIVIDKEGKEQVFKNWSTFAKAMDEQGVISTGFIRSHQDQTTEKLLDRGLTLEFEMLSVRYVVKQNDSGYYTQKK